MKKIIFSLTLLVSTVAFSQVGIGTTNPNANAILDLTATNKALVLPRVANTAAIPSPINGMMIYDISSNCVKSYENGAWTDCLSSTENAASSLTANCGGTNGFNGTFVPGAAANAAGPTTFKVTLQNNTFFTASVTPVIGDLDLGGSSLSVISVSPNTVQNITGGGSLVITYTLGGTVPASGIVTGTFTKLGVTCSNTLNLDEPFTFGFTNFFATCSKDPLATGPSTYSNWSSSATGVATVDGTTGIVSGVAAGNTYIGATPLGKSYKLGTLLAIQAFPAIVTYAPTNHTTLGSNASGTYTVPTGITSVRVEVQGAGGGGLSGGFASPPGAGGGGGGYAAATLNVTAGDLITASSGLGTGRAGQGSGTCWGSPGATSTATFGATTLTATGGNPGCSYSVRAAGGSGSVVGTATDIVTASGNGGAPNYYDGAQSGAVAAGVSGFGGGAQGFASNGGQYGNSYGGGACGANSNWLGGYGAPGAVRITPLCP